MNESAGFLVALTAGLLSFVSPCVFPLVPSYLSFVTGMTIDEMQESTDRAHVITHSLLFVSGFTLVFIVMGASATFLGRFALAYQGWVARIGGVLIVAFGLHLLGAFRIGALMRERRVHLADKPAGFMGTLVVGMAFGAGWTPCLGPALGSILTLAATRETLWSGVGLLLVYSAGLAIPFLLAALALDRFLATFRRMRRWIPWMERASGLLLIGLGVMLLTGRFTYLTAWLDRFTPEFIRSRL